MEPKVRFTLTQAFLVERVRYELRFTCEYCVHHNPETFSCVHGYPNDEHIESSLDRKGSELVFCKEFELA